MRVRTDRLDKLIDMVGELVIAQSMLNQVPQTSQARDPDLHRKVAHCGKIVRELQDLSMSLRMVPMRPTFQKLTRIVRDVAKKSGKEIQFVSTGDDTEIDRNMVDVIAEPLIHMVRNAADHGVEPTATRLAAGEPALGTVRLAAYHSSGSVVIDLSDDGGGLNKERILAKPCKGPDRAQQDPLGAGNLPADLPARVLDPGERHRHLRARRRHGRRAQEHRA